MENPKTDFYLVHPPLLLECRRGLLLLIIVDSNASTSSLEAIVPPPSSLTLLVVDDDPRVRHAAAMVLQSKGYHVIEAETPSAALRLAAPGDPIHLLITDFSMPEMTGLELARVLKEVRPKLPVLLVSGSLPNDVAIGEGFDILPKPFHAEELLSKVFALLAPGSLGAALATRT